MEEIQILKTQRILTIFFIAIGIILASCTTKKVMEDDKARFKDINEEFEKVVQVDALPSPRPNNMTVPGTPPPPTDVPPAKTSRPAPVVSAPLSERPTVKNSANANQIVKESQQKPAKPSSRRPTVDPFLAGEKIVLSMKYFNVVAGDLALNVNPFKVVNGRKAYAYSINVKSNKMFSLFYSVNNTAETFVDFENMVPLTYSMEAKETSRNKEVRVFFDWEKNEATHWEKTIKKGEKEEKKKILWTVEPFAQNVISSVFYLRTLPLVPGETLSLPIADAGKNIIFRAQVLRREKLKTSLGEFKTVVVKPSFEIGEQFKPTGDNLIWLTDDDRKFIVRVESKIKIGTLIAELKSIERGSR